MSEAVANPGLMSRFRARIARWVRRRYASETLPVLIDRRRVYVLPTRFGLFFLVLVGAMWLGALNYNNNPALLLGLLLAGAGLASLLFAHLQLSGLQAQSLSSDPVHAGEPMPLRIAFAQARPRVRNGIRVEANGNKGILNLQGSEGAVTQLALPTEKRGWLDVDRIELSTVRPLGLARAWAWLWPDLSLLVYPAPEPQGPPLPEDAHDGRHRRASPSGDDVHHLRNYQTGDALRTIAWKASARRDTLMSRTYEQSFGDDIELDWHALRGVEHETRIARLTHWIETAEREGRAYRLRIPGHPPLGPAKGAAHRHECLRALALMPEAHSV